MWQYGTAIFLLMICAGLQISSAVTDGLLPNGDFKQSLKPTDLNGTHVIGGSFALPEWEISGFIEYIQAGHKQGDMHIPVPEGAAGVRLGNGATIKQRLRVLVHH